MTEMPATTPTSESTDATETRPTAGPAPPTPPSSFVVVVALLVALWCAGFAAISVWFELTDHFEAGAYAGEATALAVANWFVAEGAPNYSVVQGVAAMLALATTVAVLAFWPARWIACSSTRPAA